MLWVNRLTKTHVVVPPDGIAIGFVIDFVANLKVHAATHILNHQTVAAWVDGLEVDIPHICTYQVLATSLLLSSGHLFPELHRSHALFLLRVHLIEPHLPTLPGLVVALSTVAQPLVEVSSMEGL